MESISAPVGAWLMAQRTAGLVSAANHRRADPVRPAVEHARHAVLDTG